MNKAAASFDLTALGKAIASLNRALARWQGSDLLDEELRDACIQRFECIFELSWKMLKRQLELDLPDAQGVDALSFRDLIRTGAERGLILNADAWMVYRDKRNITSHTYDEAKAADIAGIIPQFVLDAAGLLETLQSKGGDHA
jgi:nucleotidyltransferase substrate binding protein (TIGR01987 family)